MKTNVSNKHIFLFNQTRNYVAFIRDQFVVVVCACATVVRPLEEGIFSSATLQIRSRFQYNRLL